MRILIVEEDFVSRRLLQELLSPFGYCDSAVNGDEAIEAFRLSKEEGRPYDLICLDSKTPKGEGLEALIEIRKIEVADGVKDLEGVKMIVTTAAGEAINAHELFQSDLVAHVVKPIQRKQLAQKLEALGLLNEP